MFNCKQVSQLVSESLDHKLGLWTRMQLSMHFAMCGLCARLRKSMLRIHEEAKIHAQQIEDDQVASDLKLSETARQQIKQLIDSGSR